MSATPHLLLINPNTSVQVTALLARHAANLKAAGLHRVTVSLDALDDTIFRRMSDAECGVGEVLAGIDAAQAAGLPVKVNMGPSTACSCTYWPPTMASINSTKPISETSPMRPTRA